MSDLVEAFLRYMRAGGYSTHTIGDRRKLLRRLDQQLPEGFFGASTEELETALLPYRGWTLCTYFTTIRAAFGWAVRTGRVDWDPTTDMARPRTPLADPHPWTEAQLAVALTMPRPWRTAVILAAFEGMRCGEIARLDREDVDEQGIWILRKGGRRQQLPTNLEMVWPEVANLPAGPVVRTPRGARYNPTGLSVAVSAALGRVGLQGLTLHGGRHRFATMALRPRDQGGAGADIRTVQELLGHRSLTSTQIYTAVTDRQRRNAVAALPVPASPQQEAA